MATNRKTRKKYRQGAAFDKAHTARKRALPMLPEQVSAVLIASHLGMTRIAKGEATRNDYWTIRSTLEIAHKLAMTGYGKDLEHDITNAMSALENAAKRPRLGFTGDELQAVNLALEIYDQQIALATCGELQSAVNHVREARTN